MVFNGIACLLVLGGVMAENTTEINEEPTNCRPGYFGLKCDFPCPKGCFERTPCHTETGDCTVCIPGKFGPRCGQRCKNCDVCHQPNGSCISRCRVGYTGDRCHVKIRPASTDLTPLFIVFLVLSFVVVGVLSAIRHYRIRQALTQQKKNAEREEEMIEQAISFPELDDASRRYIMQTGSSADSASFQSLNISSTIGSASSTTLTGLEYLSDNDGQVSVSVAS